jgi:hypothetical protein
MRSDLEVDALESVWERIAQAIDSAGPAKAQLFLAKLSLLLAGAINDPEKVGAAIAAALRDLE